MKKVKKFVSGLIVAVMLLSLLVGCASSNTAETPAATPAPTETPAKAESDFPNKPITLITPYSAGGSTDIGARLIAAEAEKVFGVPVTVVNMPGASGWIGWTELLNAEKDGYTIAHMNTPSIMTGYIDPQQKRDNKIEDFAPLFMYVADWGTISVNPNETRFTNLQELIEYAKTNEVTVTTTGVFGDDHIASVKMNDAFGTKFLPVHTKGAGECLTAVMGGHVDVMFGNIGDTKVPAESGQVKTLAIMAPERNNLMPDTPTVKEVTGKEVVSFSGRGIGAPAGIPEDVYNILLEGFKKVSESEDLKTKMKEQGLDYITIMGDDYMKMLKDEEVVLYQIAPLLGWDIKK